MTKYEYRVSYRQDRNRYQTTIIENGERVARRLFKTKDEALSYGIEVRRTGVIDKPLKLDDGSRLETLGDLFDRTYEEHWQHLSSVDACVSHAESVIRLLGGTQTRIARLATAAQTVMNALSKGDLKPSTVNRKMTALSNMADVAVRYGALKEKPEIPRRKEPEHRTRYLSDDEAARLFEVIERMSEDYHDLCVVMIETGGRRGETLKLRWGDVLDDDKTKPSLQFTGTKSARARTIPLSQRAYETLMRRKAAGHRTPFGACNKHTLWRVFTRARKLADLDEPEVTPHVLRHSFASRIIQRGVNLLVLQRLLGHARLEDTARYAHLSSASMEDVREVMDVNRNEDG